MTAYTGPTSYIKRWYS